MAKFSSTRPGVPTGAQPSVEDVPVIEGAQVPLPAEEEYFQQAIPEEVKITPSTQPSEGLGDVDTTPLPTVDFDANLNRVAQAIQTGEQRQPDMLTPPVQTLSNEQLNQTLQRPLYDTQGEEITDIGQKLDIIAKEQQQSADALRRPGVIDYSSYQELSSNFNNIVPSSDLGKVQEVAANATESLTRINANVPNGGILNNTIDVTEENQTGVDLLSNAFQVDKKAAIGGVVNAASAVAMEVMSGKINTDIQSEMEDTEAAPDLFGTPDEGDVFASSVEEMGGIKEDAVVHSNGIKLKYFDSRLASAYKKYMKNLKLAEGSSPEVAQRANNDIVGSLLSETALDSGLFKLVKGNDGESYVIPTQKGVEFSRATRNMVEETISERRDIRRAKTPANQNTGWYNNYNKAKEVRNRLIPRYANTSLERNYPSPNTKRGKLSDITDFTVKVGSVPYSTTTTQLGAVALLTVLTTNNSIIAGQDPSSFLGLDSKRMQKIEDKAGGSSRGQRQRQQEYQKTVNKINNSLNTYSQILNSGPEYNYHKSDPSVHRFYPENIAVEAQNNLINRGLANNPIATHIKVTKEDINSLSNMSEASKKYFLNHFKDGGRIKDKRMELISIMAAIHKNILGKASETMTWEERVVQMTPAFIQEHGATGYQLRSAINKLGFVNNDGSINTQALTKFNLNVNPQTGELMQAQMPQLTPDEINAIGKWLSSSDKKTFGFTLSSYIALSELIDAVSNDGFWNPKVMVDMDMNSAGRTFISMDVARKEILERTGVVFSPIHKMLGGPRKLFYDQVDKVLNPKFGNDIPYLFDKSNVSLESEKADLANIMRQTFAEYAKTNPGFYDDFAKKVLLTDDYGKYMFAHDQEALSFLEKYPDFEQKVSNYYDSRTDLIQDISSLYGKVLSSNSDQWNKELPKNIVEFLQFFNRFPEPTLYFGEKAAIGSETYREIEDGPAVQINFGDRIAEFRAKEKVKDPTRAAREKLMYVAKINGNKHYVPESNTYNINLIGPLLGQYRESATLIDAVNMVNPDASKTPLWFAIVHDNLIVDGNGFAPYFFAVNSVNQGSAMKILEYDMMGEFIQDFRRQYMDIQKELSNKVKREGKGTTIDIGSNGEFAAIGARADTLYYRLKNWDNDTESGGESKYAQNRKKALRSELEMYEKIGWINPDDRGGSFKNFSVKLMDLATPQFKPTRYIKPAGSTTLVLQEAEKNMNFLDAFVFIRGMREGMDEIISSNGKFKKDSASSKKQEIINEIKRKQDLMYFFT